MRKKSRSTIEQSWPALVAVALVLAIWQLACNLGWVPSFMLPSPVAVVQAFVKEFPLLMSHSVVTLQEAFYGLGLGVALGVLCAICMDACPLLRRGLYPIILLTQTVPTVAVAPLLVLWFGYEMAPKVILIVLMTFFPMTMGVLGGFASVDADSVALLRSMGAKGWQVFRYIKLPAALPQFFAGLRIATAYAVVGAVIAEWLGGFNGLGVYMTRVKSAFAFDKMFAVIFLISFISMVFMALVNVLAKKAMPYLEE